MTQQPRLYRSDSALTSEQPYDHDHPVLSADILSSSQMRILAIHTCILRSGPISVTDIANVLQLPKSSVSRAISKLEQANWVQKKQSNGALQVSPQFKAMTMISDGYDIAWHRIAAAISPLARQFGFGFELAAMTSSGNIETVGCSDAAMIASHAEHAQFSILGAACLSGYSDRIDAEFDQSLRQKNNASCLESYAIFKRYLNEFRTSGEYHDEKKRCYFRALKLPSGETGALRLVQGTANNLSSCVELCTKEIAWLLHEDRPAK